jgi:hypothetical protein
MLTVVASAAEDQDFGERERVGMRDGQQRRSAADRRESSGGAAVKLQLRRTSVPDDLDIAPEHATREPRAERLHSRLFRGKARRKTALRYAVAPAVGHLTVGEHAVHEPIAIACDGVGNTRDVGDVQP